MCTRPLLWLPLVALPWVLSGCSEGTQAAESPAEGGFAFVDVAAEAGVTLVNVSGDPRRWYIPESNGNGAAWLDHDGDGDMDLFVGNGQGLRYENDGRRLVVERTHSWLNRFRRILVRWEKLAETYPAIRPRFFLETVFRDSPPDLTEGLHLGAGAHLEPGSFFSGLIDDIRIYNRAVRP